MLQFRQCRLHRWIARVALQINIKIVFPLPCFGRTRFKARHGNAVFFQRHQQIVHGPWLIGNADDQAGAIFARWFRRIQCLRQANDGKARFIMRLILYRVRDDMQTLRRRGAFAAQCHPIWIFFGQACAFGIAADGTALGLGQMLADPVLALRQGLRMRGHHLHAAQTLPTAQGMVAHQQADFAHDLQGRVQKQIEAARDGAFGRVFYRHHAVLRAARRRGVKDFVKIAAITQFDTGTKKLQRRLLGESARWPQHGHALRRFQTAAGRHDFAPDVANIARL